MITAKQSDANKNNSLLSTGPNTSEGKIISSFYNRVIRLLGYWVTG